MLIEVTKGALLVRLSETETIRLLPGQVVDLPAEHARKLLAKAPGKVRAVSPSLAAARDHAPTPAVRQAPGIQPGDRIGWQQADGVNQTGVIDRLHIDERGVPWAFVTRADGGWSALNLQVVTWQAIELTEEARP